MIEESTYVLHSLVWEDEEDEDEDVEDKEDGRPMMRRMRTTRTALYPPFLIFTKMHGMMLKQEKLVVTLHPTNLWAI